MTDIACGGRAPELHAAMALLFDEPAACLDYKWFRTVTTIAIPVPLMTPLLVIPPLLVTSGPIRHAIAHTKMHASNTAAGLF